MKRNNYLLYLLIIPIILFIFVYRSNFEFSTYEKELKAEGYTITTDNDSFVATKEGEHNTFVLYETADSQIVQYENEDVIYTFDIIDNNLEVATMGSQPNGEALCPSVQECEQEYFFSNHLL